jgi:hypothetical protein
VIGVDLLDRARAAGLRVSADGDRLVVRGAVRLEALAREILDRKAEMLAALRQEAEHAEADIAWRAAAMRGQVPPEGPVLLLLARPTRIEPGRCWSCGEPLQEGERFRCVPCQQAAWRALVERYPQLAAVVPATGRSRPC